ncbi:MAG: hypothetical protein WBD28_07685 [Candidatus Zixiibacteriota bacterium]
MKNLRFLIIFLGLFCVCFMITTTLKAAELPPFGIDDVFRIIYVSDPQISTDEEIVVFEAEKADSATNHYITHLWMVSTSGGEPSQLTTLDSSDTRPRFSPDGKK